MSKKKEKLIIYQSLVRLQGNTNTSCIPNGTIEQNGCGKMSDYTETFFRSIRKLGCNYIWFTGLLQQASATDYSRYGVPKQNPQVLKGQAGSPYAITDYYSVSCDLADDPARRMEEFDELVKRTHKAGLRVIIDFVPNHVARHYESVTKPEGVRDLGQDDDTSRAFYSQNNFYYFPGESLHLDGVGTQASGEPYQENPAKATGNDVFHAWPNRNDWYETVKLNYGVDYQHGGAKHFDPIPSTWEKMLNILEYWAERGVDGFRCDMAFMVPVEFWRWAIGRIKAKHKKIIFIAEIYDPSLYRSFIEYGGFDYLYDKVGLYDTLRAIVEGRESVSAITRCWQQIDGLQDHMLNFLENHDEQRIASDFFAGDPIKARPALVVSALMSTSPFLLYFGQEIGERGMDAEGFSGCDGRTTIFDYWGMPLIQRLRGNEDVWRYYRMPVAERELAAYYARVFEIAQSNEAIDRGQFYDLTYANYEQEGFNVHKHYAFFRSSRTEKLLVVANFEGEDREITVNIPEEAWEFVGLKSCRRHIYNLMTGAWDFDYHDVSKPMKIFVRAYDAAVLRFGGKRK